MLMLQKPTSEHRNKYRNIGVSDANAKSRGEHNRTIKYSTKPHHIFTPYGETSTLYTLPYVVDVIHPTIRLSRKNMTI